MIYLNVLRPLQVTLIITLLSVACTPNKPSTHPSSVSVSAGSIVHIDKFTSAHIQDRDVDVWLPQDYTPDSTYSVLYMHDGQMLFDTTHTWNHQEWGVDEVMHELASRGKIEPTIVVGIHNIPTHRHSDYFPQKPMDYFSTEDMQTIISEAHAEDQYHFGQGLQADAYLRFIVEELKPYIDSAFATHTDANNTYIAGSSMGGLISWYAVCEYPEVFGAAACISTHWVGTRPNDKQDKNEHSRVSKAFFDYLSTHLPSADAHRFYFDYGTETLDQYYPTYAEDVEKIFSEHGYALHSDGHNHRTNFVQIRFEGADHSEISWQRRLHIPLSFLLQKKNRKQAYD